MSSLRCGSSDIMNSSHRNAKTPPKIFCCEGIDLDTAFKSYRTLHIVSTLRRRKSTQKTPMHFPKILVIFGDAGMFKRFQNWTRRVCQLLFDQIKQLRMVRNVLHHLSKNWKTSGIMRVIVFGKVFPVILRNRGKETTSSSIDPSAGIG